MSRNVEKCLTISVFSLISITYNRNMKNITDEIHSELEPTFIIDFLTTMMQTEITNSVRRQKQTLLVNLSNQTIAQITAPKVARDTLPPKQTQAKIQNIATLRYIMQHDYGYGDDRPDHQINRLELHNLDECQTYVEDAIGSQLNAYFTNGLIEFMHGEKFLLTVELKQKQ